MTITRSQVADRLRIEGHFFTRAAKEVDALVAEVERLREVLGRVALIVDDPHLDSCARLDGIREILDETVPSAALTQEQ